jgi:hypothetical protein
MLASRNAISIPSDFAIVIIMVKAKNIDIKIVLSDRK